MDPENLHNKLPEKSSTLFEKWSTYSYWDDVNTQGGHDGNALQVATDNGNEAVTHLVSHWS